RRPQEALRNDAKSGFSSAEELVRDFPVSVRQFFLICYMEFIVALFLDRLPQLAIHPEHGESSLEDDGISSPASRLQHSVDTFGKGHHPAPAERIESNVRALLSSLTNQADTHVVIAELIGVEVRVSVSGSRRSRANSIFKRPLADEPFKFFYLRFPNARKLGDRGQVKRQDIAVGIECHKTA